MKLFSISNCLSKKYTLLPFFLGLLTSCTTTHYGLSYPKENQSPLENPTKTTLSSNVSTIENFVITDDLKPINIRVNVIILEREDGSGNFNLKNQEERQVLEDYLQQANQSWGNLRQPNDLTGCYTGTDYYRDSKIRFVFNYIEIKDSYYWNYKNSGSDLESKKPVLRNFSPSNNWYMKPLDSKITNDPKIPKGINLYLTLDGDIFDEVVKKKAINYKGNTMAASEFPTVSNLQRSSQIHLPNRYLKYLLHRYQAPLQSNTTWEETKLWHTQGDGKGFAHELGHSLGLGHGNSYHSPNACPFSLMSQRGNDPRDYLQPTEIIKAHDFLRRSNLIQFVTEDSFLGNTFIIEKNTIWDKTQRFYSNIHVNDEVVLTISAKTIVAPQTKISLGKNAKIVFEGQGKIIDANGKERKL
ncbi:hypothetical protein [Weeksella virosa]|uniref:Uncharacterized protein n=1 Tax=Weeksella virosa (strain ATCC 43766 / DSM 16922 / JCM 21250 / CCUG 30538 / CDC 9751 / IAM 14551 / NBRC 16016 / NCTC 11634 / CL345/78) TaxID=865938 RepID=F0P2X8_WEEVC|nr:hypothetical protein [Weeksella virosa]ADX67890.1 hypothetical protein Weevi_1181 [Weeksella virosa DSM 16922]SUP54193.1 Uncharacterised protein [Weeksella virosa]VEH64483.1 Uncharacterised protein [Weeksella virosa]